MRGNDEMETVGCESLTLDTSLCQDEGRNETGPVII